MHASMPVSPSGVLVPFRILILILAALTLPLMVRVNEGPIAWSWSTPPVVPAVEPLPPESVPEVAWAMGLFERAGLEVPNLSFEFHDELESCGGRRGLFLPAPDRVLICSLNRETVLHELAHAWAQQNVVGTARAEFLERRGLTTWDDHAFPWGERGTEHAAEIVTAALAPDVRLVRWIDEGDLDYLLLTIPDLDLAQVGDEYEILTGSPSPYLEAFEPSTRLTRSPEAGRYSPE